MKKNDLQMQIVSNYDLIQENTVFYKYLQVNTTDPCAVLLPCLTLWATQDSIWVTYDQKEYGNERELLLGLFNIDEAE